MAVTLKRNNPLHRSIASAYRANKRLGVLFNRVGKRTNPRGHVFASYRQARRAMRSVNLEAGFVAVPQIRDVFFALRADLRRGAVELAGQAIEISEQNARTQATAYGIRHEDRSFPTLGAQVSSGVDGVVSSSVRQETLSVAFAIAQEAEEMIIGDDRHEGMFNPTGAAKDERRWLAELVAAGYVEFFDGLSEAGRLPPNLMKVALAVIDTRTTETCLQVNGQVAKLDQPFLLVGEPRYADQMDGPPFHDDCRTMMAIYLSEYDDGIMKEIQGESG